MVLLWFYFDKGEEKRCGWAKVLLLKKILYFCQKYPLFQCQPPYCPNIKISRSYKRSSELWISLKKSRRQLCFARFVEKIDESRCVRDQFHIEKFNLRVVYFCICGLWNAELSQYTAGFRAMCLHNTFTESKRIYWYNHSAYIAHACNYTGCSKYNLSKFNPYKERTGFKGKLSFNKTWDYKDAVDAMSCIVIYLFFAICFYASFHLVH